MVKKVYAIVRAYPVRPQGHRRAAYRRRAADPEALSDAASGRTRWGPASIRGEPSCRASRSGSDRRLVDSPEGLPRSRRQHRARERPRVRRDLRELPWDADPL